MGKNKLRKYSEVATFSNVLPCREEETDIKELKDFCNQDRDIILELGCGKGDYCVNLARKYPDKNFIGVDIKGARLWHGAKIALEENIDNALFLRMQIEHLDKFLSRDSVSELWITFPDPYLKRPKKNGKKRLTSERFLNIYRKVLKKGATLHLKTDDDTLFNFTMETLEETGAKIHAATDDLYNSKYLNDLTSIQTTYEMKYLKENKTIKYIRFSIE
ncbi:MAG: tRNA (guanosine(46)-N7)-methyltransferase TrmB [Desulfobacterales bacterium]|nr:tRNA (guanosine(46)-N7)-methyltransferase TrmB [Desulfobacterales bacterium]MCP4160475.1 tRNA (guanosine(46)-N7)-methyltransferase TrmB [Deltaproteobacteria bacterium]